MNEPRMNRLLTAKELAPILSIHHKDVYELVALEGLPCIRIGRRLRFDPSDIQRWLSARKEE